MKKALTFLTLTALLAAVIFFGGRSILKTLYPTDYGDFVEKYAAENNLSVSFVYAVIECESSFNKDAVSYADAMGLMQLTHQTFRWLQTKKGEELPDEMLFDPETNIKYGCFFFGILMKTYENEETALAAYHAGMGNVSKWLKNEDYSSDGRTLHTVPFESTAEYVKKVLKTKNIYSQLYK